MYYADDNVTYTERYLQETMGMISLHVFPLSNKEFGEG